LDRLNILIAGVGGQGVVLAGDILGEVALQAGMDVKKTDTLGMAQRGGSVVAHIRIGEKVASPLIGDGEADMLLALEKLEGARWAHLLKTGATVIINDLAIPPLSVSQGNDSYPFDDEMNHLLRHRAGDVLLIQGSRRAAEMGNSKVLNVLMLGALSMLVPYGPDIWDTVIRQRLPAKILEINLSAFEQGRREMLDALAMPDRYSQWAQHHDDDCCCH
jgi:indolepyruvate ferredoxin oxidoreductase beta subunit